jgi:phage N-6-adenine-methyltransferase
VRRLLAPLTSVCEQTRCSLLLVRHLNKALGGPALYRGGGSIGIVGDARAGMLVARDPDDDSGDRRVLAMTKSNLAKEAPALAYRLVDNGRGVVRVEWLGETSHTAADLLAGQTDPEEHSARVDAKEFLTETLADGPVEAAEVRRQARVAGIADPTLKRAKADLHVQSVKEGFGDRGRWMWRLDPLRGSKGTKGDHHSGVSPLGESDPLSDDGAVGEDADEDADRTPTPPGPRAMKQGVKVTIGGVVLLASDTWATPPSVFDPLNDEFHFTLDVCAEPGTAKVGRFLTPADDGLSQSWADEVGWLNPPYSRGQLERWLGKAWREVKHNRATVVALVPYDPSTKWWRMWVASLRDQHDGPVAVEVREGLGRVAFLHPETGRPEKSGARGPSAIVIYRPRTEGEP